MELKEPGKVRVRKRCSEAGLSTRQERRTETEILTSVRACQDEQASNNMVGSDQLRAFLHARRAVYDLFRP